LLLLHLQVQTSPLGQKPLVSIQSLWLPSYPVSQFQ
jgi:hypothetical protein